MLSSTFISYLAIVSLVGTSYAIPLTYIKPADICRRTISIADKAALIGETVSYIECQIGEQSKSAAVALGLPGIVSVVCVAPASLASTPSPVVASPPSRPVAATIPKVISPVVVAPAVFAPIPTPITKPAPVVLGIPVPAAAIIPVTPASAPAPLIVSAPIIVSAPLAVSAPLGPFESATPITPSSSLTAAQLDACTSNDPDVCYEQALALSAHNAVRAKHHVEPLVWNHDLAAAALKWATNCKWGHSHGSLFPSDFIYGENIYASTLDEPQTNMITAVTAYTNEEVLYDYNNPGFSDATGHFTQVVWKATKEVGCVIINCNLDAFTKYTTSSSYNVCVYYPSGNYEGQFAENVLRP